MRSVKRAAKTLLALTIFLPGLVIPVKAAQYEAEAPSEAFETANSNPISADAPPRPEAAAVASMGPAVDTGKLGDYRGGSEVSNTILPKGFVNDNSAVNVVTGMNLIGEGAFTNASGLPMVIQNSGANVLIQNATIVNVQLQ